MSTPLWFGLLEFFLTPFPDLQRMPAQHHLPDPGTEHSIDYRETFYIFIPLFLPRTTLNSFEILFP